MTEPGRLAPIDVASGYLFGESPDVEPLPDPGRRPSPRRELEAAVAEALRRPPCLVAFSGGRDSSAVLALAAAVARREGLPLPIPFTHRFSGAPGAEESEWQELVIRHLRLDDWATSQIDDELDSVGPIAARALTRHGLYWPANAHLIVPALEAAAGGSVLTGAGGDQLLDPGRHRRLAASLALRAAPRPRDLVRLALAAAPAGAREAVRRRRDPPRIECPWLRPAAVAALVDAAVRDAAREPVRRPAFVEWVWRSRSTQAGLRIMRSLAGDAGALLVHPFFSPAPIAAFGAWAGRNPPRDRTAAMRALFSDLLPASVCERRSKAVFAEPFWGRRTRAFAATLRPDDVDSELVDGTRAVEFWARPEESGVPVFRSLTLLQSAWLARAPASREPVE